MIEWKIPTNDISLLRHIKTQNENGSSTRYRCKKFYVKKHMHVNHNMSTTFTKLLDKKLTINNNERKTTKIQKPKKKGCKRITTLYLEREECWVCSLVASQSPNGVALLGPCGDQSWEWIGARQTPTRANH